jgi:hypothetical protein
MIESLPEREMRRLRVFVFAVIAASFVVAARVVPAAMLGMTPRVGSWNGLTRPYLSTSLRGRN